MSTKAERTQTIERLAEEFSKAGSIYFTDFSRISVEKMTRLRAEFRKHGAKYLVIKNSLGRKALERCDEAKKKLVDYLVGHVGVVFAEGDTIAPARIIRDFQKENADLLPVKVAYINGVEYGAADMQKLADLPSREILMSMLLSCLSAPIGNLAGGLSAILTNFVGVLDALKQKKEVAVA